MSITLMQLTAALGPVLRPLDGTPPEPRPVNGVHISELPDPTPYLEGGELLLTTGIPFGSPGVLPHDYVARLVGAEVSGLVFGLGEGFDAVPPALVSACADADLPLLVVPDGQPFQRVTRTFWDLVASSGRSSMFESLGTQTRLARAASVDEPIAQVVTILAQALGGWAAYIPLAVRGEATFRPTSLSGLLPNLRSEVQRLFESATFAAASFSTHGHDVVAYPIAVRGRTVGAVAVGVTRALSKADKQVVLTAQAVLAGIRTGTDAASASMEASQLVALLALEGQAEAARLTADWCGLDHLPARVRVIATVGTDGASADALQRKLGGEPTGSWCVLDGVRFDLVDASAPLPNDVTGIRGIAAAVSAPVPLSALREAAAQTRRLALSAAPGSVIDADRPDADRAAGWIDELERYRRAPLLPTVTAHLRSRGNWEETSRLLQLHRNTIRHRIAVAENLIGGSLSDPDVSAELWLALRHRSSGA